MKKNLFYLLLVICLLIPRCVFGNTIYNMDIDVYLDENGNASITEVWDVLGTNGTEWYKGMTNMGNSVLTDFKVKMDDEELTYKVWNVDESLSQKKGYYGINYIDNGLELCFGKYDFKRHKFTLTYNLSNMVYNTSDSQVLYYKFIDKFSSVKFKNYSVKIHSYYEFPETLDVWSFGAKGFAYSKDGVISASNDGDMGDNYLVLLVKFPVGTFDTSNKSSYNSFDEIYNKAYEGSFEYDYSEKVSLIDKIINFIMTFLPLVLGGLFVFIGCKVTLNSKYGYKDNKTIDKKNTPMFRDIPCNKDIYYGNVLIYLNNFGYKDTNVLGAIILKWVREDKIKFINTKSGIFNKETSALDLTLNPTFEYDLERKLFDMMYEASRDGILEAKELEKWCKNNYSKFLNLFDSFKNDMIKKLENNGSIYKRSSKEECKYGHVMDDIIYNDSQQLYGLKLFLEEFSKMNEKEVMDVKLWDEYLMFAYLFGIADKVAKQLKNLYPEVLEQANFDYDTLIFVNSLSYSSVHAASSARMAAESYSGGGGGFSIGGGGGGSFGGGGGGSR